MADDEHPIKDCIDCYLPFIGPKARCTTCQAIYDDCMADYYDELNTDTFTGDDYEDVDEARSV